MDNKPSNTIIEKKPSNTVVQKSEYLINVFKLILMYSLYVEISGLLLLCCITQK